MQCVTCSHRSILTGWCAVDAGLRVFTFQCSDAKLTRQWVLIEFLLVLLCDQGAGAVALGAGSDGSSPIRCYCCCFPAIPLRDDSKLLKPGIDVPSACRIVATPIDKSWHRYSTRKTEEFAPTWRPQLHAVDVPVILGKLENGAIPPQCRGGVHNGCPRCR